MKKLVISLTLLLTLSLVLGTAGCGGSNDEEKIRELLDEQIAALNNLDLETVYNQRSPDYKSNVTLEEFENFLMMAYADLLPEVESG